MLNSLYLKRNRLTGTLPKEYFSVPNVFVGGNLLTGTIPTEIGLFEHSRLFLGQNFLTGSIPDEVYSLSSLTKLEIGQNLVSFCPLKCMFRNE